MYNSNRFISKEGWVIDTVTRENVTWEYQPDSRIKTDSPMSPDDPPESRGNYRISLITCAICKDGKDAGEIYGCVSWGFSLINDSDASRHMELTTPTYFAGGNVNSLPEVVKGTGAVEAWNQGARALARREGDANVYLFGSNTPLPRPKPLDD